ncbi:hypothetical protein D5018_12835 [Parashewanella curva]|uniref:Uncharacterized protein n=2 Tax=Parashewanella curva TaxID=2338552 RepID=A0A3L8PV52_9GAMM|nr:hypothetical protein D5018_12835 [Parashewanella curva]
MGDTPQTPSNLINGLPPSKDNVDVVNNGSIARSKLSEFCAHYQVTNLCRIPVAEFQGARHVHAVQSGIVNELGCNQRQFVHFNLQHTTVEVDKEYIALSIVQSGQGSKLGKVESNEGYIPPILSNQNALIYRVVNVRQEVTFDELEKMAQDSEVNFSHGLNSIYDLDSLKQTLLSRYQHSRKDLGLTESNISQQTVAITWFELVGYVDERDQRVNLPEPQHIQVGEMRIQLDDVHELLTILNVAPEEKNFHDLATVVKQWRRPPGILRSQQPDVVVTKEKKAQCLAVFKKMGFVDETHPALNQYDHGVIMGAAIPTMQNRVEQMEKIIKQEVQCSKLFTLTSARKLTEQPDQFTQYNQAHSQLTPLSTEHNETDAMAHIVSQSSLSPVIPVFCDAMIEEKGIRRPANTSDTLQRYQQRHRVEKGKSLLMVTSQPHAMYQLASAQKTFFPERPTIALTANKAPEDTRLITCLDSLDSVFRVA